MTTTLTVGNGLTTWSTGGGTTRPRCAARDGSRQEQHGAGGAVMSRPTCVEEPHLAAVSSWSTVAGLWCLRTPIWPRRVLVLVEGQEKRRPTHRRSTAARPRMCATRVTRLQPNAFRLHIWTGAIGKKRLRPLFDPRRRGVLRASASVRVGDRHRKHGRESAGFARVPVCVKIAADPARRFELPGRQQGAGGANVSRRPACGAALR